MLIKETKSVIPACDVDESKFEELVKSTCDIDGIGAYKLGFALGLSMGLPRAVEVVRKYTKKPVIYDHQKAATDIPDTGKHFAKVCKRAGVDCVILFPQAGPETERAWIEAAKDEGLCVMVGGLMTHKGYVASDGGYIADDAIKRMYSVAAEMGVCDYVVPGNKPAVIEAIRSMMEGRGIEAALYSPGFIAQGGSLSDAAAAAGKRYHAIVGRAIYSADDMRGAADKLCREFLNPCTRM